MGKSEEDLLRTAGGSLGDLPMMDAESRNDGGDAEEAGLCRHAPSARRSTCLQPCAAVVLTELPAAGGAEVLPLTLPKLFCRLIARGSPQRTHRLTSTVFASSHTA